MNASIRLVLAACLSFCVILPVSAADEAYDPQEAAKVDKAEQKSSETSGDDSTLREKCEDALDGLKNKVEKKLESKQRGGTASVRG